MGKRVPVEEIREGDRIYREYSYDNVVTHVNHTPGHGYYIHYARTDSDRNPYEWTFVEERRTVLAEQKEES